MNYYNEFDPAAAAWLRELIARKLIPDGIVDERSITEIHAPDLQAFTQCHFFAGIGGWSLALQLAGVSPDTRLWTGSCPCQPFSSAGKGEGKEDERHLWPTFFKLIEACRPPVVFGEQVASALVVGKAGGGHREEDGPVWLDGVFADLESAGYTTGATVLGAHSVGAPHIRQRLYWVARSVGDRREVALLDAGSRDASDQVGEADQPRGNRPHTLGLAHTELARRPETGLRPEIDAGREPQSGRAPRGSANSLGEGLEGHRRDERDGGEPGRLYPLAAGSVAAGGSVGGMGDAPGRGLGIIGDAPRPGSGGHADGSGGASCGVGDTDSGGLSGGQKQHGESQDHPSDRSSCWEHPGRFGGYGHWSDSVWLPCRDGKHRRVPAQSVLQPVADGLPDLVGSGWSDLLEATPGLAEAAKGFPLASSDPFKLATRGTVRPALLKGAGNAIVPEVAATFISAFYEVTAP